MAMADVRVVIDEQAIKDLAGDPGMRTEILDRAGTLVPGAQGRAPKDTGAGAASIHAEPFLEDGEWTARMSWARDRYYMGLIQRGTKSLPARPFLEE